MKSTIKFLSFTLGIIAIYETAWGQQQAIGDFRTHQNGNWSSTSTWERLDSTFTWVYPAPHTPTSADGVISISYGDTVIITTGITADQLFVNGTLEVENGSVLTIADGAGTDLTDWYNSTIRVNGGLINNGTAEIGGTLQIIGALTNNWTTQIEGTFQLDRGGSVSGNNLIYGLNGTLVFNNLLVPYSVDGGDIVWPNTNGPTAVFVQGSGGITMNADRTLRDLYTSAHIGNANNLTLSGQVQLNAGGSFDSSPLYSGNATLIFNTGDDHNIGSEWRSGTSVGSGVPMHVVIYDGTTVNMPGSARTCPGDLTIYGTLVLSTTAGADLSVGGNWYCTGTLISNARTITFNGSTEQIVAGVTTFDYLTVNNPAGITLQGGEGDSTIVTVNQMLTFTVGHIRLKSYVYGSFLILSGAVSGAALTRHVVTYDECFVIRSITGGGSFQFPISPTETSYNPVTIALDPTDSTETFSVRVDSTIDLGAPDDSLFVQRTWDIREATPGDNHAALTFQWAGAEEGKKFTRNASSTYLYDIEVAQNSVASGTDPYVVGTTGGFPCTDFARYTVGNTGALTHEEAITGLIVANDGPTPLDSVTTFSATVTTGTNVYFSWSFGDGTSDSGDVVTHTYTAAGNYTAIVTATNTLGSASDTTVVNIYIAPIAGLTASNDGPTPLGSATTLTATVEEGSRVSYVWNFGDGTPVDSGAVVKHTYRAVGIYLAVVTATNAVTTFTDTTKVIVTPTTKVEEAEKGIPTAFLLAQNYPNPFNPVTTIQFAVPRESYVRLKVYNSFGAEVATLVDQHIAAGTYKVSWDASRLASGLYLYRLETEGFAQTKKLLLMK